MHPKTNNFLHGFTLIELLIVVAIIAILAAIAVPNFLEAQTRSKVSRVRADQRTIATALQSYQVDYNVYPWWSPAGYPNSNVYWKPPYSGGGSRIPLAFAQGLTTPIAYISSIQMGDPFTANKEHKEQIFFYVEQAGHETEAVVGSYGYDRDRETMHALMPQNTSSSTVYGLFSMGPDGRYYDTLAWPAGHAHWTEYDPTNGTVSQGNIWRFGP
jgi:prepilin-type N-terminal cleavage/methylation domain-containing protein